MKKVLYIIFKIFFIVISIYLLSLFVLFILYNLFDLKNQAKSDYYYKIKKSKKEVSLSEIFDDFDWDKAYILKNNGLSQEEIENEIGIKCNIDVIDTSWPDSYRINTIVFIRNDECIYEFYYDEKYLKFDNKGKFINNDNSRYKIKKGIKRMELSFKDNNL